jgi:hypothetical protein
MCRWRPLRPPVVACDQMVEAYRVKMLMTNAVFEIAMDYRGDAGLLAGSALRKIPAC